MNKTMTTEKLISNIMKDLKKRGKFKTPEEVDEFFENALHRVKFNAIENCFRP